MLSASLNEFYDLDHSRVSDIPQEVVWQWPEGRGKMSLMEEGVVGKSSLSPFSTLFFGNYSQEFLFGNNILRAFNSIQIHETIEMIKFMLKYSSQEILKFFSLLLPFSCPVFYCYLFIPGN